MFHNGRAILGLLVGGLTLAAGCAAPAPTATPTQPPVAAATPTKAAPTPTKAPTATPTKRPLVKASVTIPGRPLVQLPWVVAEAKGYFPEEGLDLDFVLVVGGAKGLAAVVGQSAHLTTAAAPEVLSAVAQGQPIQSVAQLIQGEIYTIIIRSDVAKQIGVSEKSSVTDRVRAIKGLKMGSSSPGGGSDSSMRYVLTKYNIDADRDLEVSYMSTEARQSGIQAGAIDGFVHTEPESSVPVASGLAIVLIQMARDFPETRINAGTMISLHKSVLASQPEIPEAFIRASWRAIRLLKTNRADAEEAYRQKAYPDLDRGAFKLAFDAVYQLHLPDSPAVSKEAFQAALDYRNKTTAGEPISAKYEDFYTSKFVEAAKKQLGY